MSSHSYLAKYYLCTELSLVFFSYRPLSSTTGGLVIEERQPAMAAGDPFKHALEQKQQQVNLKGLVLLRMYLRHKLQGRGWQASLAQRLYFEI